MNSRNQSSPERTVYGPIEDTEMPWKMTVTSDGEVKLPFYYRRTVPSDNFYRRLAHTSLYDLQDGVSTANPNVSPTRSPLWTIRSGVAAFLGNRNHTDQQIGAVNSILSEMAANAMRPRSKDNPETQNGNNARLLVMLSKPENPEKTTSYVGFVETVDTRKLLRKLAMASMLDNKPELPDDESIRGRGDFMIDYLGNEVDQGIKLTTYAKGGVVWIPSLLTKIVEVPLLRPPSDSPIAN
jgi:hypothetical protein